MGGTSIQQALFSLQDADYHAFQCKLMPGVPPEQVIGVRMPDLRKLAKSLMGTAEETAFLRTLPHTYYEERNLHGLLLSAWNDYDAVCAALEIFLPHVDNWATCDLIQPRAFRAHPPALPEQLRRWLESRHPYTVRFALKMLMDHYLDQDFQPCYLDWATGVDSTEYYVNMMLAWYFATALAKQYRQTLPLLEQHTLSRWVHNKTIQKAVESYRIPPEHKDVLRALRWKNN